MSEDNLRYYSRCEKVPKEALKPILAGRLKGKSDINPMWRIKVLTDMFGPVGVGWKYVITKKELIPGADGAIAAFVDIELYYKENNEWSAPIPGTGGNMFIAKESNGLYTDDDCFKKSLTDAISVAAKALGVGGKVYWESDPGKYGKNEPSQAEQEKGINKAVQEIKTIEQITNQYLDIKNELGMLPNVAQEEYETKYDCKMLFASKESLLNAVKESSIELLYTLSEKLKITKEKMDALFLKTYKTKVEDAPIESIEKAIEETRNKIKEKEKAKEGKVNE